MTRIDGDLYSAEDRFVVRIQLINTRPIPWDRFSHLKVWREPEDETMGSVFLYNCFGRINADPLRCGTVWSVNRFQETDKFVVRDRFLESIQLVPIRRLRERRQALGERGDRSENDREGRSCEKP
jgi:hypothetical protein